jgi:hypothetical protein
MGEMGHCDSSETEENVEVAVKSLVVRVGTCIKIEPRSSGQQNYNERREEWQGRRTTVSAIQGRIECFHDFGHGDPGLTNRLGRSGGSAK